MSDERLAELARLIETGGGRPIYADEAAELLAEVERLRAPAQLGSALVDALRELREWHGLTIIRPLNFSDGRRDDYIVSREDGRGETIETDATRRLSALLAAFQQESR